MTSDSCDDSEEEEEEEMEEMDLDGMAPTSKRRKFGQHTALHASLHSGIIHTFWVCMVPHTTLTPVLAMQWNICYCFGRPVFVS